MASSLGPRARRAYLALRGRIVRGNLSPGTRLPPQRELAAELAVSLVTLREALAQLAQEGLVVSEHGLGTFVRSPSRPTVLVVEDDPACRLLLREHATAAGYRVLDAIGPGEALAALEAEPDIALLLTDVRMPEAAGGVGLIRRVRARWPELPLVAITAYPDDLTELHGTPECPLIILPKPLRPSQIEQVLRLALPRAGVP